MQNPIPQRIYLHQSVNSLILQILIPTISPALVRECHPELVEGNVTLSLSKGLLDACGKACLCFDRLSMTGGKNAIQLAALKGQNITAMGVGHRKSNNTNKALNERNDFG